jgi:hypothetical protein
MNRIDVGIDRQTINPDVTRVMKAVVCRSHTIEPLWATVTG